MDRRAFLGGLAGGLLAAPLSTEDPENSQVYELARLDTLATLRPTGNITVEEDAMARDRSILANQFLLTLTLGGTLLSGCAKEITVIES
jgi:hypothetical protein